MLAAEKGASRVIRGGDGMLLRLLPPSGRRSPPQSRFQNSCFQNHCMFPIKYLRLSFDDDMFPIKYLRLLFDDDLFVCLRIADNFRKLGVFVMY